MQCALVAETNLIAKSDDLHSRKRGQSVKYFSFNFFKKSTAKVLRYYRGTFNLKVPVPQY